MILRDISCDIHKYASEISKCSKQINDHKKWKTTSKKTTIEMECQLVNNISRNSAAINAKTQNFRLKKAEKTRKLTKLNN